MKRGGTAGTEATGSDVRQISWSTSCLCEIKCWCSSSSGPLPELEGEHFQSSVQHGVQLVGQVIEHVTDVVQDGPGRSDRVGAAAENETTQ